jgi:putative transferase (TIGR04331 family)
MKSRNLSLTDLDLKFLKKRYKLIDNYRVQLNYQDFENLYSKIFLKIVSFLNRAHNCQKKNIYWKIIIGPWLISYIASFLDRANTIKSFLKSEKSTKYKYRIYNFNKEKIHKFQSFNNYVECIKNFDDWNHHAYIKIIKFKYLKQFKILNVNLPTIKLKKKNKVNKLEFSLILIFLKLYFFFQKNIVFEFTIIKKNIIFFILNFRNILFENLMSQLFNNYFEKIEKYSVEKNNSNYDIIKRKKFLIQNTKNFEEFIFNNAVMDIPINYLENLNNLRKISNYLSIKNKNIFSFYCQINSDFYKIWLAENRIYKNKIFIFDHGGGLKAKNDCHANHESEISNKIFTWSKLRIKYSNSRQVSPYKIIKLNNLTQFKKNKTISLVCGNVGKYLIWASPMPTLNQFYDDIKALNIFLDEIMTIELKKNVIIKLPKVLEKSKNQQQNNQFWKKRFFNFFDKRIKFYSFETKISNLLQNSRIIILTSPQTILSEVLISNTPFILMFKTKHWPLNSIHQKILSKLKNIIYFDDPYKAAMLIKKNYENIEAWWSSSRIQYLRSYLKNNICNVNNDWKEQLKNLKY